MLRNFFGKHSAFFMPWGRGSGIVKSCSGGHPTLLAGNDRGSSVSFVVLCACIGMMSLWLFVAASVIGIDYSDAYAAIANAQYFLGISDGYFGQRGPLMALLLMPAEWAANRLDLHPLDIRPHHFTLALAHVLYLVALTGILLKEYKNRRSVLVAFLIAIPTFIFFSYAPFLSHDIFPGILFLAMLVLAERFVERPRTDIWLTLVITGLLVALVKHTYALCWLAVLVVRVLPFAVPNRLKVSPALAVLLLVIGAIASAIATWLIYAWALEGWAPQIDFLRRPYVQVLSIPAAFADDPSIEYPWWFFLRNYPIGYGIVNAVLILPAIYIAIRSGSRLRQSIGLAWIFVFLSMHLLTFFETRYLAFLMPLSAFLFVPLARFLWLRRRRWAPILILLLTVDLSRAGLEAVRIFDPFYSKNQFKEFFAPIDDRKGPVIITRDIGFTPNRYSPLVADRYHRIFHMPPLAVARLYQLPKEEVFLLTPPEHRLPLPLADPARFGDGALLFYANKILIRRANPIPSRPEAFQGEFIQLSARARRRWYERHGTVLQSLDGGSHPFLLFQFTEDGGSGKLFSVDANLSEAQAQEIAKPRVGNGPLEVWGYEAIAICSSQSGGFDDCSTY